MISFFKKAVKCFKSVALPGMFSLVLFMIALLISDVFIKNSATNYLYDSTSDLPFCNVAVVLGTSRYTIKGYRNPHYYARLDAAVRLFHEHKARYFIVSGDNSSPYYNEPAKMKQYLVNAGIPARLVYCDYAGFRTLDSIVRASKVFGQHHFVIISQRYQNERAVYIAHNYGIDAIGFNAPGDFSILDIRNQLRKRLARLLAIIDVNFLHTQPYFLGPLIIPGKTPPS